MTILMRRLLGLAGGVVLGVTLGNAADAAGVTPNNDGDMAVSGLVAGLGYGMTSRRECAPMTGRWSERCAEGGRSDL